MIERQQYWAEEIGKFLSGNSTEEEGSKLSSWIEENEENRAFFEEMKSVWQITHPVDLAVDLDLDLQWESVAGRLRSGQKPGAKLRVLYRVVAAAAAIALLIFAIHSKNREAVSFNQPVLVSTDISEDNTVVALPDGSTVWLRAGSRITYDQEFSVRDVQLTGEGFFDVESDPESPFKVYTSKAVVEVLGTRFNLRENEGGDVELFVEEGMVAFTTDDQTGEAQVFEREEMAVMRIQTLEVEPITAPSSNVMSWRTGSLTFDDVPMSKALQDLQRHYSVAFMVEDSALLECDLKSDFENSSIEGVIETIEFMFGWQLVEENDVIHISGEPCNRNQE